MTPPLSRVGGGVLTQQDRYGLLHDPADVRRGRFGHIGLHAANLDDFNENRSRLMAAGATDGTVTDFGRKLGLFFCDPDRMEYKVLVANPEPGQMPIGSASHIYA